MKRGLVSGEVLYTDATHLKANANKNKFEVVRVEVKPQEYLGQLEQAIERDRAAEGKRELKAATSGPKTKEIKVSRTDREAGYMVREGKPKGFFYLDHRTVDARHAIITDRHATPATVHDSVPYLRRLDRQRERFGFGVQAVGLDAGYATTAIAKGLEERGIYGVTGYRTPNHGEGLFSKRKFGYDVERDVYVCPGQQLLVYRTTNREGYRQYHSDARQCRECPLRLQCTRSRNMVKVVTRHVWQAARDRWTRVVWSREEKRFTSAGKRRWNAASPMRNNCTAIATRECVVWSMCGNNACWQRRRRTSRKLRCC